MLSFQHDSKTECPEMLKQFRQRGKGIREKTLELGDVCDLSRGQYNRMTCSMSISDQIELSAVRG